MPILAGIDYSLSCPAICIYDTEKGDFCYKNTKAYFRSNLARFESFREGNIEGCNHGPWKDEIDRYDDISNWAMGILKHHKVDQVYLEGYSYGSTGRVFNIAENTAVLKYNLWEHFIHVDVIPPTTVKKFATGKGNASKSDMYDAFCKEAGDLDLRGLLTPRSSGVISPLNDVIDAYFILKFGIFN